MRYLLFFFGLTKKKGDFSYLQVGVENRFQIFSNYQNCIASFDRVGVKITYQATGAEVPYFFSTPPCDEATGVYVVAFTPCEPGVHTITILEDGKPTQFVQPFAKPKPKEIEYVEGPSTQLAFEFGGMVPEVKHGST